MIPQFNRNAIRRGLALGAALLPAPPFAAAQEGVLEEVIVTAQKREQALRDVPATVNVLSAEYLRRQVISDFSQMSDFIPGVEIQGNADGSLTTLRVRGIGTNPNSGVAPSVGIFINEIPLVDFAVAFANTVELERVEVLKGPQSTLFGRAVSSGAIALTTRSPEIGAGSGYAEMNIGSHGLRELYGGGNLSLGGAAAARGSLYRLEEDGPGRNVTLSESAMMRENFGGRAQLLLQPSDSLALKLSVEKHAIESKGTERVVLEYGDGSEALAAANNVALTAYDLDDRKQQDAFGVIRETDTEIAALHIDWELDDAWSVRSITAWQDWSRDGDRSLASESISFDSVLGPVPYQPGIVRTSADSLSQELRGTYASDFITSVFGSFYADSSQQNVAELLRPVLVGAPLYLAIEAGPVIDTEEWGIYSHNTLSVDDFDIVLGLRYSVTAREGYAATILGGGAFVEQHATGIPNLPPVATAEPEQQDDEWSNVSGGAKLLYHLSDDASLYASYDRGYKPGNFRTQTVVGPQAITAEPFAEEIADSFELGAKALLFGRSLQLNGALFYQEYEDYQVGIVDPITAMSTIENAGAVEVRGAELDFAYLLGEHLSFEGGFAYIDSEFAEYENASCNRPQYAAAHCTPTGREHRRDLSGEEVNAVSPWSFNLASTWRNTLSNGYGIYARLSYRYRGSRTFASDLDPGTKDGAYSVYDFSLGWVSPREFVSADVWAKNLSDTEYMVSIESNSDGIQRAGLRGLPGREFSLGLRLRLQW